MSQPTAHRKPSRESAHTGFMRHRGFRWAKFALLLCIACIAAYVWHEPLDGPSGGSWLGYTLGGIALALVVFLAWLGVRKRRYGSSLGTLKGWTSAHVYLGLALVLIATLHSGFQFGLNIHTLAYTLMVLVVVSGIYGIVVYAKLPQEIARLRTGSTRDAWIEELLDLNDEALKLAEPMGPDVHRKVVGSIEKVQIGGGLRRQLYGSKKQKRSLEQFSDALQQRLKALIDSAPPETFNPSATQQSTVMFMAGQLGSGDKSALDLQRLQQLLDVIGRRNALVTRINRDIALHARLQVWLLLHVPLTFALIAALIAHIVSVFFYW
ncbi:MAG: hypothetical protein Q7J29_13540 [Stagnimonas sp.]|nr:hypothetical protein [Stagnimonas sp.]